MVAPMSKRLPRASALAFALVACTASRRDSLHLDGATQPDAPVGGDLEGRSSDAGPPDRARDLAGRLANGLDCAEPGDCLSGFCSGGVCCDSACTGACTSCTLAGLAGTCALQPAGTVCRAASDLCDEAESCSGASPDCPANRYKPSSFVCRPAAGDCDLADTCAGTGPACPNSFKDRSSVCRPAAGPCDLPESCSGLTAACPPDVLRGFGYPCRNLGPDPFCDPADLCTGTSAVCQKLVLADGTLCGAEGACGETCSDGVCGATSPCFPYRCNGPAGCYKSCLTDAECVAGNVCTGPPSPTAVGTCAPPQSSGGKGVWRTAPGYHRYDSFNNTTPVPTAPTGPCSPGEFAYVKVASAPFRILVHRDPAGDQACVSNGAAPAAYNQVVAATPTSTAKIGYVTGEGCPGGLATHWIIDHPHPYCLPAGLGPTALVDSGGQVDQCALSSWNVYLLYSCSL
jgi:hypothetical protein